MPAAKAEAQFRPLRRRARRLPLSLSTDRPVRRHGRIDGNVRMSPNEQVAPVLPPERFEVWDWPEPTSRRNRRGTAPPMRFSSVVLSNDKETTGCWRFSRAGNRAPGHSPAPSANLHPIGARSEAAVTTTVSGIPSRGAPVVVTVLRLQPRRVATDPRRAGGRRPGSMSRHPSHPNGYRRRSSRFSWRSRSRLPTKWLLKI
jgi:hypothetical protein